MSGELIEALHEKMRNLHKMRNHLVYSQTQVRSWWATSISFADWSERQLESLAAFKARFAELQDHLAAAMRLIANIEEEDTRMFTYVLNYMEQIGVLEDRWEWQKIRDLRNAATHDYSDSDEVKSQRFDNLLQSTAYLLSVLERLDALVVKHYSDDRKV